MPPPIETSRARLFSESSSCERSSSPVFQPDDTCRRAASLFVEWADMHIVINYVDENTGYDVVTVYFVRGRRTESLNSRDRSRIGRMIFQRGVLVGIIRNAQRYFPIAISSYSFNRSPSPLSIIVTTSKKCTCPRTIQEVLAITSNYNPWRNPFLNVIVFECET